MHLTDFTFGPVINDDGTTTFRLWAPALEEVGLIVGDRPPVPMEQQENGFFLVNAPAQIGDSYAFDLGDITIPDPASRFQPRGVHAPSRLIEVTQPITTWQGVAKGDLIIYELHVGTFTKEGTYRAAEGRLPDLVELGITAIELMPLAQAAGMWNWGYDGVNLYAPNQAYGTPQQLRDFVDTAHELGLAVILDVVYNHFGPEGNYLGLLGGYLSKRHKTPWGDAPNFDGDDAPVLRQFILENIDYWIGVFEFDGIRLDATHCIADESDPHIAREIGERCRSWEKELDRPIHLIAESNVYDPELLVPLEDEGFGFNALWCDDFLHSVYAALAPGTHLSDRRYEPDTDLDLILRRGYVFHGTLRTARERHLLEKYPGRVGMESIVAAIQHHDFIGNHPAGLRLHQTTSPDAQRAAAALLLLSPSIPMLFMGEEFASDSPFYFFADFEDPKIRRAVEKGRRAEHPQHDWKNAVSPLSNAALENSKIGLSEEGDEGMLAWYRTLIAIRKEWQTARILSSANLDAEWHPQNSTGVLRYRAGSKDGERFLVVRLHEVDSNPGTIRIKMDGKSLVSQNLDSTTGEAGKFSVVVGSGNVEIL